MMADKKLHGQGFFVSQYLLLGNQHWEKAAAFVPCFCGFIGVWLATVQYKMLD